MSRRTYLLQQINKFNCIDDVKNFEIKFGTPGKKKYLYQMTVDELEEVYNSVKDNEIAVEIPTDTLKVFLNSLEESLISNGITRKEMSFVLNISQTELSNFFSCKHKSLSMIKKIIEYTKCRSTPEDSIKKEAE